MATTQNLRSISLNSDSSIGVYTGVPGLPGSASPNLGKQYRFVKLTGMRQVGQATAGADKIVGILQNKPQVPGEAATVGYHGESMVVTGGAIAVGDLVAPDSAGKAITDGTNGKWAALEPAAGADILISVFRA